MKGFGIGTTVMLLAIATSGPIYAQQSQPSQRPAETGQSALTDDQAFVNEMTIANLAEVQLGKLATERASNTDVKAFGQMMVQDHTKANDELKQIASQLKIAATDRAGPEAQGTGGQIVEVAGLPGSIANTSTRWCRATRRSWASYAHAQIRRCQAHIVGGTDSGTGERRPPDKGLPDVTTNSNKPVAQDPALAKAQAGKGATTGRGLGDDALTQWAAKAMSTVQKHLDRARELQQKLASR